MSETLFGNIVTIEKVPENEIHFVIPGEYIHYLKPNELPWTVSVEDFKISDDGTISCNVVSRMNGTLVEVKPPQLVGKIVNIGGGE